MFYTKVLANAYTRAFRLPHTSLLYILNILLHNNLLGTLLFMFFLLCVNTKMLLKNRIFYEHLSFRRHWVVVSSLTVHNTLE